MTKPGQLRVGHPLAEHGAIYNFTNVDDLIEAAVELRACQLIADGKLVRDQDEVKIRQEVRRQKRRQERAISKIGLPKDIKSLLQARDKRGAERLGSRVTIRENDLFLAIHNCGQIGFSHRSKFCEFIPTHLHVDREDFVKDGKPQEKAVKKASSLFKFRRQVQVHFFESKSLWHCFYFSYEDIENETDNHWKMGAHLHYVSYLWPNLEAAKVWESFEKRKTDITNGIHIKFMPFKFDSTEGTGSGSIIENLLPTEVKILKSLQPIPTAVLLTRGQWIARYTFPDNRTKQRGAIKI
jgi:hypothetical protein